MSCCPKAPEIEVSALVADEPTMGPEVERIPGESEDCFMKRGGNISESGQVDDKTVEVPGKIAQNSVVPSGDAAINLQFTVTGPVPATNWVFTPSSFPGPVTMTAGGLMSGSFDPSVHNNKLTVRVQAYNGATLMDDRTYDFSPSIYDSSNSIQLTHPLPGSIMTSKFGPRRSPAAGASSQHKGCDFAYAGGITKDALCAADGEVTLARPGTGYGNYVMVKHLNPAGRHLITTLYAHLDAIYVKVGQKVRGGQAVGKEGSTGIGSGAHLHFEVRLSDDTKVDPAPYLSGGAVAANIVNPNNTPSEAAGTTPVEGGKAVTASEVAARTSCAPFGPGYPSTGVPPETPTTAPAVVPPANIGDPFERAWYFTMTHEVNAKWMTTPPRSPSDADVAAGLIETADQRQRVGFVNHPKDPGGVTKFGVAQRFNPSERVQEMAYAAARQTGYNVYWLAANNNCQTIAATSPRIAVMVFDMNYLMGAGGSRRTVLAAGVTTTETGAAEIVALEKLTEARLAYLRSRPGWPTFGRGWTKRANECLEYAKA